MAPLSQVCGAPPIIVSPSCIFNSGLNFILNNEIEQKNYSYLIPLVMKASTDQTEVSGNKFVEENNYSNDDQILMQNSVRSFLENYYSGKLESVNKNEFLENGTEEQNKNVIVDSDDDNDVKDNKEITLFKEDNENEKCSRPERRRKSYSTSRNEGKGKIYIKKESKLNYFRTERVLVPKVEKLQVKASVGVNTYKKFYTYMEKIFEEVEDFIIDEEFTNGDYPSEALIPNDQLKNLCAYAEKLNFFGDMRLVSPEKITKLLIILEGNIRDGAEISPFSDPNDDEIEKKLFVEAAIERIMRAVDGCLIILHILTARNMDKKFYIEDVIDRVIIFTKFQLYNTVYPAFDSTYQTKKNEKHSPTGNKKKSQGRDLQNKYIMKLYKKLTEIISLLAKLINIQALTDNSILLLSSMTISPFFVEGVIDLQMAALKLVTITFSKYEKHRKLMLDDIISSLARSPSSKRNIRSYKLCDGQYIQMFTALVLQLVQSVVILPQNMNTELSSEIDYFMENKYKIARTTASVFIYSLLTKSSNKSEEADFKTLFGNFIQDLFTVLNKPEWPAAELMLSILGSLLVNNVVNKSLEVSVRIVSLDYLGLVATGIRKDLTMTDNNKNTIDEILRGINCCESNDNISKNKNIKCADQITPIYGAMLNYLAIRSLKDVVIDNARHYYIVEWYCSGEITSQKHLKKRSKMAGKSSNPLAGGSTDEEDEQKQQKSDDISLKAKKKFLLSKVYPFEEVNLEERLIQVLQTPINSLTAELILRHLNLQKKISHRFEIYLKHILKALTEKSVLLRTKAIKCLDSIVEIDSSVLGLKEMQLGISHLFLDQSTSVREAAVDLIGKFILNQPKLISSYYDMLSERILDTGVSVRKRVIKIFKDICIEYPHFSKVPEICVKIIRRINDEDGIRKLVLEVVQNLWFTPVKEKPVLDSDSLVKKVINITDAISAANDITLEWLEQLLVAMFKPPDNKDESSKNKNEISQTLLTACRQIVDCLMETILQLEQSVGGDDTSQRIVICLMLFHLFAKIKPQLVSHHAFMLQPLLSRTAQTQNDYQIISYVARILELIVPLVSQPSDTFLSRLEADSIKLIMEQDPSVVHSCVSSLGSVVNNVTKNYAIIRECLTKYYSFLNLYYEKLKSGICTSEIMQKVRPLFRRSIYIVGLLLRYFDLTNKEVIGDDIPLTIKDDIFNIFLFFLNNEQDSQHYILKAVGSACIRHYEFMLRTELKSLYHKYLVDDDVPLQMKVQVLNNIESYLLEEERSMIKKDQEWIKRSKNENLKEMGDVTSGMASTIIQVYLKEILGASIHVHISIRSAAIKVIQLILMQGLVHPVQIIPYLICMSTDDDKSVSSNALKHLQDIEKRYPGFIHMKAQSGMQLSYKLQKIIQHEQDIVRGFRVKEGEPLPTALNGFLYSSLRNKQQRRALVMSILKQFEDHVKTNLEEMLFLADNLAYFPYQVQDEPLFIIHHIDIILSLTGANLLQSFREALLPIKDEEKNLSVGEDEEDEDVESLLQRLPEDITIFQQYLTASQGCLLLIVLKQHLKTLFGFNDAKITQYSPSENTKVYEKNVSKKSNSKFNPSCILNKLKEGSSTNVMDKKAKKVLISEYLEFKTLIMNLDPDESDDEEANGTNCNTPEKTVLKVKEFIAKKEQAAELCETQEKNVDNIKQAKQSPQKRSPQKVHSSHRTRKPERHKKHHKRKRKIISSDDSDIDC